MSCSPEIYFPIIFTLVKMWRKYKSQFTLPIVHNPAINPSYLKYSVYEDNWPHANVCLYPGPVLEILNASSSGGLVYSAGSYLTIECVYVNTSKVRQAGQSDIYVFLLIWLNHTDEFFSRLNLSPLPSTLCSPWIEKFPWRKMFSNGNSTIEHSLFKIGKGDFWKSLIINLGYICFKWHNIKNVLGYCRWSQQFSV